MNHRQWKKNYKKQHGCNPPLEADKKKRARLAIELIHHFNEIPDFAPQLSKALEEAAEVAGVTLKEMADSFSRVIERWNIERWNNGEGRN